MIDKLEMVVSESMYYIIKELQKESVDFKVDNEKQQIRVKGEITLKDPTIIVEEEQVPSALFEGLYDD